MSKKRIFDEELPRIPSAMRIVEEMKARGDVIRFDLTSDCRSDPHACPKEERCGRYWMGHPQEFWEQFRHTDEILVPHRFEDWIIGQDEAKEKLRLNLIEWPKKLKDLAKLAESKRPVSQILKERPGPYILMIGEPGTGKSLLIKVAAEYLRDLYRQHGIELYDVLAVKNPQDDYAPYIRYARAGDGRRIVDAAKTQMSKDKLKWGILKKVLAFFIVLGLLFIASGLLVWFYLVFLQDPTYAWWVGGPMWTQWLTLGLMFTFWPLFILIIARMRSGSLGLFVGGDLDAHVPNLLVDNADEQMWVDATVGNATLLFGDIEWDPYGSSKPGHLRMKGGDIHKANRKLLYIDEIKNLRENLAIELLTVMEDGATEIRGHEGIGGTSHSASQMVKSRSKIDSLFFLMAAGNMDVLYDPNSVLNRVTALRDRFEGYGDIILMKDEMADTPLNRMKIAQVVTDETFRFNFPPATRDAVMEIIHLMRRGASSNNKLKMRFRRVIGVLRRAAQLCWDTDDRFIRAEHVQEAQAMNVPIEEADAIEQVDKERDYKIVYTEGKELGMVNGLVVLTRGSAEYMAGDVAPVVAWLKKVDDPAKADFVVTGIAQDEGSWIRDSIKAVRTSIYKLYNVDLAKDYYVHISFLQRRGIDGPSAGTTMTLAIMSLLEDKPLRQDIAVTGTVEIAAAGGGDDVRVGPVAGVYEKCLGARRWGIKGVIVPKENYEKTLDETIRREIRVITCSTIRDYFRVLAGGD